MENDKRLFFKGFERSPQFEHFFHRLQVLERWMELAIRPSSLKDCDPEDYDLYLQPMDNVKALQARCLQVRQQMNHPNHFPKSIQHSPGNWEQHLVPQTSTLPNAGLGLFYQPNSRHNNDATSIPKGTVICYYTGHLHNFHSAKTLTDTSYLMLVADDCLVDPGPLFNIVKARFINDPTATIIIRKDKDIPSMDTDKGMSPIPYPLNCKYVPDPSNLRSAVVTLCDISPGQELFVAYGDAYWARNPLPAQGSTVAASDH